MTHNLQNDLRVRKNEFEYKKREWQMRLPAKSTSLKESRKVAKQKISISAIDGAKRFLYLIRLLEGKQLEMMIIKKKYA